ncbi:MAG: hypothetical protein GON13_04040 [Nanoarchaeota archaeon]|nr:hypothetical protein [Nanoarchaeota archaeon]
MILETITIITAFLTGKLIKTKTSKEIEQWKKLINATPLILSITVLLITIFNYSNSLQLGLIGILISFLFRKKNDHLATLFFATITILTYPNNLTIITLFIIYFMIKGSVFKKKIVLGITPIILGFIAIFALNFVKNISVEQSLILTSLFCGAIIGSELSNVIKNKSETKQRKK